MSKTNSNIYPIDWLVYSAIFFMILLPFIEYGWLKVGSVALVLGFFGGILNRFLREYYGYLETRNQAGTKNRVTSRYYKVNL